MVLISRGRRAHTKGVGSGEVLGEQQQRGAHMRPAFK